MAKTAKRPPNDYDADLRIRPLPGENMTAEELFERGVKSLFHDDPPPREAPQPKKFKTA